MPASSCTMGVPWWSSTGLILKREWSQFQIPVCIAASILNSHDKLAKKRVEHGHLTRPPPFVARESHHWVVFGCQIGKRCLLMCL